MFLTRLISGIVLVILALFVNILGGPVLLLSMLGISLIGMFELYRAVGIQKKGIGLLSGVAYLGAILWYVFVWFHLTDLYMLIISGTLIALLFIYVFSYPRYHAEEVFGTFFGLLYVAVSLSFIYQTRALPEGKWHVWLIIICAWGCDTTAYAVGRLLGKHKMAPVLSPKKSVEGAIGGIIGAALIGLIYGLSIRGFLEEKASIGLIYALIGAVGAMISMIGDLAASAIKRNHEIKDYGHLIPGHGGILDRFDSVIITAPIIYFLSYLLG